MSNDQPFDLSDSTPRDPRRDALHAEWLNHQRSREQREAQHQEVLGRERATYDARLNQKHQQANLLEEIEQERLQRLRSLRLELDSEVIVAQDIAARAYARLGLEYRPGQSKVSDLYRVEPLPESLAAERAGVPLSVTVNDGLLKVLKFAGMGGCIMLGTLGMGALLLHIPPKSLLHSPLALVALGLSFILVGGAYLIVAPASRRLGAQTARRPRDPETTRARMAVSFLVAVVTVIVALVDTKALMAINSARSMIDPASAPSFALTFLIATALSATYVLGTSMLAFNEGLALEARKRIEMEQDRHQNDHRERQKNSLEVAQACEALNAVDVIETRRKALNEEIRAVEQGLQQSLNDTYADTGPVPELSEEQRKELRLHEQEARFAEQKLNAYESVRNKFRGSSKSSSDGGDA